MGVRSCGWSDGNVMCYESMKCAVLGQVKALASTFRTVKRVHDNPCKRHKIIIGARDRSNGVRGPVGARTSTVLHARTSYVPVPYTVNIMKNSDEREKKRTWTIQSLHLLRQPPLGGFLRRILAWNTRLHRRRGTQQPTVLSPMRCSSREM